MDFGLFSNGERLPGLAADAYDEDLYEIVQADRLGYREAWISEHVGGNVNTLSVADLFICKAAALTRQIRLAPGVRPLALYHPIQVAIEAAMCDHLTRGRYMFGFGLGGPARGQMEQRGLGSTADEVRRPMMHEAMDLILRCWTAEQPFDFEGRYWHGKNILPMPQPYQKPYMPVGVACQFHSGSSLGTADRAGRDGFLPLFSQYDDAASIRALADQFVAAAAAAGRAPDRGQIRVCRLVWVADSLRQAKAELRPRLEASIARRKRIFPEQFAHVLPQGGTLEDVTFDYLVDSGHYFVGEADRVAELIARLYQQTGGFGVLLLIAGKDYGTRQQRARSLKLFMQRVAPQLRDLQPEPHAGAVREPALV